MCFSCRQVRESRHYVHDVQPYCKSLLNPSSPATMCAALRGDPYVEPKPEPPQPNDGWFLRRPPHSELGHMRPAGHSGFGLTVDQLESFNEKKTWGWTEMRHHDGGLQHVSQQGEPATSPPQQGTQCGPMVPGNEADQQVDRHDGSEPVSLKACCSNWGYCGPFPTHCDIHSSPDGAPGTKLPGFDSTSISGCGTDIKQNSGPPANFSRIGYYESWNMARPCLWMKAENANPNWYYTHVHWGFAEIDPQTWKVVLKDPNNQWQGFKNLQHVKRIVSFGGWAYSTEPATYNIIRQAIITNYEAFATNVAQFIANEGIDGVDIDWEYPGVSCLL